MFLIFPNFQKKFSEFLFERRFFLWKFSTEFFFSFSCFVLCSWIWIENFKKFFYSHKWTNGKKSLWKKYFVWKKRSFTSENFTNRQTGRKQILINKIYNTRSIKTRWLKIRSYCIFFWIYTHIQIEKILSLNNPNFSTLIYLDVFWYIIIVIKKSSPFSPYHYPSP